MGERTRESKQEYHQATHTSIVKHLTFKLKYLNISPFYKKEIKKIKFKTGKNNEIKFKFMGEDPKSILNDGGGRPRKFDPPGFGKWTFWKKGGVKTT